VELPVWTKIEEGQDDNEDEDEVYFFFDEEKEKNFSLSNVLVLENELLDDLATE
jgi:hypothetical protein